MFALQSFLGNGAHRVKWFPALKIEPGRGGVVQDLVDAFLELLCKFVQNSQSPQGVLKVLHSSRTNKSRISVGILDNPGQGEMNQLAPNLISDFPQLNETVHSLFIIVGRVEKLLGQLDREGAGLVSKAVEIVLLQPLDIPPSEKASAKGTPSYEAVVVFVEERVVLDLVLLTHQHTVLVLGSNRLVQIQPFTDAQSFKDSLSPPVTGGPIEGLTPLNNLMKSAAYLFNRSDLVLKMSIDNIHIVQLQSLERFLHTFPDMLPIGRITRVDVGILGGAHLGSNDHLFTGHLEVLKDAAQLKFGLSGRVYLGSVEVVDAVLESQGNDLLVLLVSLSPMVDHVAQRDSRYFQAGVTEVAVHHVPGLQH